MNKYINKPDLHQYTRAFGHPNLVESVAKFVQPYFTSKIDAMSNILVSGGGVACLNSAMIGLMNPGDEAIFFEPCYDCYYPQVKIAG